MKCKPRYPQFTIVDDTVTITVHAPVKVCAKCGTRWICVLERIEIDSSMDRLKLWDQVRTSCLEDSLLHDNYRAVWFSGPFLFYRVGLLCVSCGKQYQEFIGKYPWKHTIDDDVSAVDNAWLNGSGR